MGRERSCGFLSDYGYVCGDYGRLVDRDVLLCESRRKTVNSTIMITSQSGQALQMPSDHSIKTGFSRQNRISWSDDDVP